MAVYDLKIDEKNVDAVQINSIFLSHIEELRDVILDFQEAYGNNMSAADKIFVEKLYSNIFALEEVQEEVLKYLGCTEKEDSEDEEN